MAYRKHIHCLLIAIFLILLLQPAFGIINEKRNLDLIAEMENRTINPKPHSSLTSKAFYNEFQNWFEDRLLGRKQFIRLWAGVNGRLFHVLISKRVCMGKDGFLYSPFYLKDEMMDREQKLEQLTKIKQVCDKYRAHFVFNLIPHAEWMFGEQILKKHQPADVRKLENELESDLKKRGIDYCMYGQKILQLPLKERQSMYYQGDFHWNSKGAYFGAKELLRYLKLNKNIESKNIYEVEEIATSEFYTGEIGWEPSKTVYKKPWSYDFEKGFIIRTNVGDKLIQRDIENGIQKGEIIISNSKAANIITVLVLGDSFFNSLGEYLMQDIKEIVLCHNVDAFDPKQSIDLNQLLQRYKPKIVIYEKAAIGLFCNSYQANFGKWKL